jgi:phosphatidylglycerophosphatase A
MSQPTPSTPTPTTSNPARKPRVSIAIATAFGLGYLPKAPGTWGSLGGLVLATLPWWLVLSTRAVSDFIFMYMWSPGDPFAYLQCLLTVGVALLGLWAANRASRFWGIKDPQKIVIDEVSGQQLALLLGGFWPWHMPAATNAFETPERWAYHPLGVGMLHSVNWKYLLLGFILFRVFDIWKPFPARQAEALPGGLGIMADDWIAGIYAALGLWIARALGM